MPDEEEYEEGTRNLEKADWKVDLVLTHCCATSLQKNAFGEGDYVPDQLTDYLEEIRNRLDYHYWLFGHYHENRQLTEKDYVLYEQIVRLPDREGASKE